MPPTKLQRWIDLIAFLAGRRYPVTVGQIMEAVPSYAGGGAEDTTGAVRQMFERDKVELREAGIPIRRTEFTINHGAERIEGYVLAREDFHLPYLRLLRQAGAPEATSREARGPSGATAEFHVHEDDLRAALEGLEHVRHLPSSPLATDAASAFRKLTFDLPNTFPTPPTALYLDPPGVADSRQNLEALSDALLRGKTVSFRYHGIRRGEPTDRRVEPYGLMFRQSRWYLVGRDQAREGVRVFRVSRMEEVVVNSSRPRTRDYEIPPDFDLAAYANREAWQLARGEGAPLKARVLFRFPRSLWADRNGHGALVEELDDGSAVREFDLTETGPFLRWLLPQADEVRVELPSELREELTRMAAHVAEVHGSEAP